MRNTGWIYLFTNKVNGKRYIGQTIQGHKRIRDHKNRSVSEETPLYRAIRKYGWDSFDIQFIWEGLSGELDDKERQFIQEYNCLSPNGYNLDGGGTLGKTFSSETLHKLSEISSRFWESEEYRNRVLTSRKEALANDPGFFERRARSLRKTWSDPKFREKMIERLKKALDTPEARFNKAQDMKKRWSSSNYREKVIKNMKKTASSPGEKERKSKVSRESWSDPDKKEAASKRMRKRWENPEWRAKMSEVQKNRWEKQKSCQA